MNPLFNLEWYAIRLQSYSNIRINGFEKFTKSADNKRRRITNLQVKNRILKDFDKLEHCLKINRIEIYREQMSST